MRLTLISVGRIAESFIEEACNYYGDKIARFATLRQVVVPEERVKAAGREAYILRQESARLRGKVPSGSFRIVLDEKGRLLSSRSFASSFEKWGQTGLKEMTFIVGGPYGLNEEIKAEADFRLSLSPLTLTHAMARMVLLEQIYRAFTILRGEPYHKE